MTSVEAIKNISAALNTGDYGTVHLPKGKSNDVKSGANEVSDEITIIDLKKVVNEIKKSAKNMDASVQFEIDENAHKIIAKVINKDTGEMIRQVPSEEILAIAARITALIRK